MQHDGGNMGIFIVWFFCYYSLLLIYMVKEAFANRVIYNVWNFLLFQKALERLICFLFPTFIVGKFQIKSLNQLQGKVDLVIIGGDLTEKGVPLQRVKENIT